MHNRRRYSGRQLMTFGALFLLIWAGYECYIRLEMLSWWFSGITRMCASEGIPFTRAITYFDASMFKLAAYLLALALFAIAAMILRNRPLGDYAILALTICALVAGGNWVNLFSLSVFDWAQTLKILPLALIGVGCLINISQFYVRRAGKGGRGEESDGRDADYTRMDRRELAHEVKRYKPKKSDDAA